VQKWPLRGVAGTSFRVGDNRTLSLTNSSLERVRYAPEVRSGGYVPTTLPRT